MSPTELFQDNIFYLYYSQFQLAMGLSGFDTCDFVVYTFKSLIIVRTEFENFVFLILIVLSRH